MIPEPSASPAGSRTGRVHQVCCTVAGAIAVLVLVSWLLGRWQVGTLGTECTPMAPSTALLVLGLAGAAWLQRRRPDSAAANGFGWAAGVGTLALSLFLLAAPHARQARRFALGFLALALLVTITISVTGWLYFKRQRVEVRRAAVTHRAARRRLRL